MASVHNGETESMLLATLVQLVGLAASALTVECLVTDDAHSEIIRKYLVAAKSEALAPRAAAVEVTIQASVPKLKRQATLRALRITSAAGTVTYTVLNSCGDAMIKREVIARYLAAESQTRATVETAITPFNYQFQPKGVIEKESRQVYVFHLSPRRKKVGLFRGELQVDGRTGLPIHESGQFIKSPSVFIKRISFTRDYVARGWFDVPVHIHSTVESRIVGRVELDIEFADPSVSNAMEVTPNAE
ncbi:MAG: hypothetical protein ABI833_07730 [Acidobacteriota bacterium]